jgi:hypothetical protein
MTGFCLDQEIESDPCEALSIERRIQEVLNL